MDSSSAWNVPYPLHTTHYTRTLAHTYAHIHAHAPTHVTRITHVQAHVTHVLPIRLTDSTTFHTLSYNYAILHELVPL